MVGALLPRSGVASLAFLPTLLRTLTSPSVLYPSVVSSWTGVAAGGRFQEVPEVLEGVRGGLEPSSRRDFPLDFRELPDDDR